MTTWSRYTYSTNIQRWYSYTKSCTCTHQLLFKPCGSSFPLFTSCASSSLLFHLRKCLRHFQYKIIEKRFTFKTWNSCVLKKRSNVLGISVRSLKSFDVYGRTDPHGNIAFFAFHTFLVEVHPNEEKIESGPNYITAVHIFIIPCWDYVCRFLWVARNQSLSTAFWELHQWPADC